MTTAEAIVDVLKTRGAQDTESLAFQILAYHEEARHVAALEAWQHSSGAWSSGEVGPANCFHTGLALLALRSVAPDERMAPNIRRAFAWIDSTSGIENHWLWKWKFRYFDRQVRFDTRKVGWPWVEGTVSWVAPTAIVLLAHRVWNRQSPRLTSAIAMLIDRACPDGGWNAGNSEVFGVPLDPHPDFTAMALLALQGKVSRETDIVAKALDYLPKRLRGSTSLYSLAWATLALRTWKHPGETALLMQLRDQLDPRELSRLPVLTLAMAALANETPRRFPVGAAR